MILIIDNYDSFAYNLAQYFKELGEEVVVVRNDAVSVAEIEALEPSAIVIGPGSGSVAEAGCAGEVVAAFEGRVPLLGVSLGHQVIATHYGARLVPVKQIMHGKCSEITASGEGLFRGMAGRPFKAMRYDSLVVERESLPEVLEVTAESESGEVMAVAHRERAVFGVQFHPESIMTPVGKRVLRNFLKAAGNGEL